MDSAVDAYVISSALRLRGPIQADAIRRSLEQICARHDVLRTYLQMVDGQLRQYVNVQVALPWVESDVSDSADPLADCQAALRRDAEQPFDLGQAPLWRVRLCRLSDDDWVLGLNVHHVAADAWSLELIQQELAVMYQAEMAGTRPMLPTPTTRYGEIAAEQQGAPGADLLAQAKQFWRDKFRDLPPRVSPLPDVSVRRRALPAAGVMRRDIDDMRTDALRGLASMHDASLFMALAALVDLLLYRHCGERDVTIGTPVSGRVGRDQETLVGLFMNLVALRVVVDPNQGFSSLLNSVASASIAALEHQRYPFDVLVEDLALTRDAASAPLFDVLVALQNVNLADAIVAGIRVGEFELGATTAKYDLVFEFAEHDGGLVFNLTYNADLYGAETIERLGAHFERLLEAVTVNPDRPLREIAMLSRAERRQLDTWSGGASAYPRDAGLASLFAEQVATA
ncbi:MAG: hypothetical protein CMQ61_01125, partial [Gammaproteobacteria bacterium]|nr:hypothetical protein [Gammaproteobacteria bacterium]